MAIVHTYTIAFSSKGGVVIFSMRLDATSKKQAEDTGKEMADALLPILQVHYQSLGLGCMDRLKVMAWRE